MKKNINFLMLHNMNIVTQKSFFELTIDSNILVFYRKYLKRFIFARYIANKLKVIIRNSSFILSSFKNNQLNSSFELKNINSYCRNSNIDSYRLADEIRTTFQPPQILQNKGLNLIYYAIDEYFSPLYLYELKNAFCISNSNFVFCNSYALHHSMYDFYADGTSEELHGRFEINPYKNLLIINNFNFLRFKEIEIAASFLDACSGNYAHWLSEVLSKITIFCSLENFKHVPILIDAKLHDNILESLLYCVDDGRQVIIVSQGLCVRVKKLYFMDALGYVPFEHRKNSDFLYHGQGKFHPLGLHTLQKTLTESIDIVNNSESIRNIYIKRKSNVRNLLNDSEIEHSLAKRGFYPVDTSLMSFVEQFYMFKNASVVVGSTGAALANCIFCQPGTIVIVLIGRHPKMIYEYWYKMLSILKIKVGFVLGDIKNGNVDGIHGDFSVSLAEVNNLLDEFGVEK